MTIAIYPGSFDPITNGHLDVAQRAARVFDKVIIGVYDTPEKKLMFSQAERVEMARLAVKNIPNVEVQPYSGLTVGFAHKVKAPVMVRGLRVSADFEFEFQMTAMNQQLDRNIETVFLMPSERHSFLSSSLLKEIAKFNADISSFVPKCVAKRLKERLKK